MKHSRIQRTIPVNKGNYSMETPEREALFDHFRGEGWEKEYCNYRQNWVSYPSKQFISDYPLLVDIELSTRCNLRCPMCYTITNEFKKRVKPRLMGFGLFTKIIDEIRGKVPAIRLSLRGEPTIHPKFIACVDYAKRSGIQEVSTLTNGSTLSTEFILKMMQAGIDWLTISVDGLDGTYESIRRPLKFRALLQKLKDIKRIKDKTGAHKPVVKIQSIWPAIKQNPENFYNTLSPYVDLIAFNPLIDYLGKDEEIVYENNFICCQLYQRLVVGANGGAMMCSNDEDGTIIVGDAEKQSIHSIWHGSALNKLRAVHRKKNGFLQIAVCRKCYLPRLTEESETAQINGREFTIKNYVNRNQRIGQ
ncbi:MAG TPA: radical SAM protein [Elusimicrobia bacterium]|nr:radical SAM protein [Elusimicrobiota bacterium]HBT62220.1 radical SAM protein [Elusimicrobiota bacterium]